MKGIGSIFASDFVIDNLYTPKLLPYVSQGTKRIKSSKTHTFSQDTEVKNTKRVPS